MTRRIGFLLLLATASSSQTSTYVLPAPAQPLPFSHKLHAAKGLDCKACHTMPDPGDRATFPVTAKCMACHVEIKKESEAVQKLADYHKKRETIPWKRVYSVAECPQVHVTKAKAACETCHGPVRERDVLRKEKETSMAVSVDCHKASGASVACDYSHEQR